MGTGFTVQDFMDRSGAGASSLRTYRKLLSKCESMVGRPLGEATARDLGDLKVRLRQMRSGPNYVRRLKAFYKVAAATEGLSRDERERYEGLAAICVLKQRVRRLSPDEILTPAEVNDMLAAADSMRDRALIATLWATGQRVGAVCALKLGDLMEPENDGGTMRVTFRKVKVAGEEHVSWVLDVDGGDHLRAWLAVYPFDRSKDAPLFPSWNPVAGGGHGGKSPDGARALLAPLTESGALKVVQSTATRAKIGKRVYCHLFRHSRATHLLRLGMSATDVKKQCGWAPGSPIMERTYSHLADHDALRAIKKANGLQVPEIADVGKIAAAASFKAVVPMAAPPGNRPKGVGRRGSVDRPEDVIEQNPQVAAAFLAILKDIAEHPDGMAWLQDSAAGKFVKGKADGKGDGT
jgi:integrase